jgi:hypothetical protein
LNYKGNELYSEASKLYQEETDHRIKLKSYGKPPSREVIENVVNEMEPWMRTVGLGLPWNDDESLKQIIELGTGSTWVRYKMIDPRVEDYRKRARLEMLKGTPLPLAEALTPEAMNAVASMWIAQMQQGAKDYLDKMKKEKS